MRRVIIRANVQESFRLSRCVNHASAQEIGDSVADTPWEAQPQYGCPDPPPDSCPNRPAVQPAADPIHNFMDYSVDACMTQVCMADSSLEGLPSGYVIGAGRRT